MGDALFYEAGNNDVWKWRNVLWELTLFYVNAALKIREGEMVFFLSENERPIHLHVRPGWSNKCTLITLGNIAIVVKGERDGHIPANV